MKVRDFIYCLVILLLLMSIFSRKSPRETVTVSRQTDTVYLRDTLRVSVPEPYEVYVTRVDTIYVPVSVEVEGKRDTVSVPVPIPIENKEYKTPDYYAIVRGYRPELVRLELYPESRIVYDTETRTITKRPRFGIGIQAGYGYSGKVQPYIGVGLQYNIFSF